MRDRIDDYCTYANKVAESDAEIARLREELAEAVANVAIGREHLEHMTARAEKADSRAEHAEKAFLYVLDAFDDSGYIHPEYREYESELLAVWSGEGE